MTFLWLVIAFAAGLAAAHLVSWRGLLELWTEWTRGPAGTPATLATQTGMSTQPSLAGASTATANGALPTAAALTPTADSAAEDSATAASASRAVQIRRLCNQMSELTEHIAHARELANEPQFREMIKIMSDRGMPLAEVEDYVFGNSWPHQCAALAALVGRGDGYKSADAVLKNFGMFGVWAMAYALDYFASLDGYILAGAPLAQHEPWWTDTPLVRREFELYFEKLDAKSALAEVSREVLAKDQSLPQIRHFLHRVGGAFAKRLAARIPAPHDEPPQQQQNFSSNPTPEPQSGDAFLNGIGRFWTTPAGLDLPEEPAGWRDGLDAARTAIDRTPRRSLLVTGGPLSGKTSFLRLLAMRLEKENWRVFEAGGADLQAGQQWIGQLEGRIRQLIQELDAGRKIIWYVPDLLQLALSGTHLGQSASMLDQILPAITQGRLLVWGETSPTSAARLLQLRPQLRRAFEVVRLEPMGAEATRPLAAAMATKLEREFKLQIDPSFAETAIDAAQHYLSASSLPGSALSLMKVSVLRAGEAKGRRLTGADVLETLAQLTGLPRSLLDGSERLDLADVRKFFAGRVIGQDEAVSTIVDRIAMLKSGLNDPMKPFGVFLFAGPTGTGKTELAKAIAEYLFGSVDRMVRLDMSEYQAPDSIVKITGGPALPPDADTLISRIRKQPFSLILLDEFEKSCPQVWDLCLQMFDEGRLTDANGQTADFRHSLIILTTNLGATTHQSAGLGFAPTQSLYTNEQVLRAIGQTFRPEFQNRLDNVIVFKPLTRELMRGILTKELARLYDRRGLKERGWAVEWEASALEFLLEKGFSPDMGARPLKRAIDQHVVAPLAAAIVERRAPEGEQFVFVRSDGDAIQALFVDPDGDGTPVSSDDPPLPVAVSRGPVSLPAIMLHPTGAPAEIDALASAQETIAARIGAPAWETEKARLSAAINEAGFWSRADRFETLGRYELMDRLAVAADTGASLQSRLARRRRQPAGALEIVGRLAMQLRLVQEGLRDLDESAPTETALLIEPAFEMHPSERRAAALWHREVLDMYRAWCRRRNMQLAELEPITEGGLPVAVIGGFGAHRTLAREAGVHVLELGESANGQSRLAARVLIVPSPVGVVSRAQLRTALIEALAKAPRTGTVVRRYRREPSPLVRNADGSWRTGRLDAVLAGDFDLMAGDAA